MFCRSGYSGNGQTRDDGQIVRHIFDRICTSENIDPVGPRGQYLARFLVTEFCYGNRDERCLFECAHWLVKRQTPSLQIPPKCLKPGLCTVH
ncbi:hypothetical protein BLJAPNOD_05553 [Ensifer sp. M14]|nr:hypothetical protein BLJAPNOD_05553 [Ensifer sp. M14]